MNIYRCRWQPKVGAGDGTGGADLKKKKNAGEVIRQGYIQVSSINRCLKMAVGGDGSGTWRWLEVVVQGCGGDGGWGGST